MLDNHKSKRITSINLKQRKLASTKYYRTKKTVPSSWHIVGGHVVLVNTWLHFCWLCKITSESMQNILPVWKISSSPIQLPIHYQNPSRPAFMKASPTKRQHLMPTRLTASYMEISALAHVHKFKSHPSFDVR